MYRRRLKKKRRKQRYGDYFYRLMEPTMIKCYDEYIRRIKVLRRQVNDLGSVPHKKTQLIKTLQYFISLINLATKFVDSGILEYAPEEKAESINEFNSAITMLTFRNNGTVHVQNKTPVGGTVMYNNLYIGVISEAKGECRKDCKRETINGKEYDVEVQPVSVRDWINFRAKSVDGRLALLKQEELADLCEKLTKILLETIDDVLKET